MNVLCYSQAAHTHFSLLARPLTIPSLLPHTLGCLPFSQSCTYPGLILLLVLLVERLRQPSSSHSPCSSPIPFPRRRSLLCTPLPWQQVLHHCSVPCSGCPFLQPLPNNPLVTRTSPVKKNGGVGWGGVWFNLPSPGCLPGAWPHNALSSGR